MKAITYYLLPLILAIIVSMHWLDTNIRRGIILLILGTLLWFFFKLLKEHVVPLRIVISITVVTIVSFLLIVLTLLKTGW